MSENSLVAKPQGPEALKGAGIFESGANLIDGTFGKDAGEDWDAFALSMDGLAFGLDAISMVMNPLGELVKAGVGWLMEHLDFIREPLEVLTGDPAQIQAIAQTWNNIAAEMEAIAGDYDGALAGTSGWGGEAADAYRKLAVAYTGSLRQVAEQSRGAAQGITTAGIVVGTARAIIFDLIATFISDVIVRALMALASSWFTLGGSVALFAASVVADAVALMARIQKKIGKLLSAIQQFVKKFNVLGSKSADAAKALGRKSTELGREANKALRSAARTADDLAPTAGAAKKYVDYVDKMSKTPVGQAADHVATKTVKEAGQQAKDQHDQYTGGSDADGRYKPATTGRITGSIADE